MRRTIRNSTAIKATSREDEVFLEIVRLIAAAREKAIHAVNTALIDLYWQIGAIISRKIGQRNGATVSLRNCRIHRPDLSRPSRLYPPQFI
jgi:hypothetical protein